MASYTVFRTSTRIKHTMLTHVSIIKTTFFLFGSAKFGAATPTLSECVTACEDKKLPAGQTCLKDLYDIKTCIHNLCLTNGLKPKITPPTISPKV